MKKCFYLFFALLLSASALNAQTNEVATPLFSADLENVVSMYCDENAETFYLYTKKIANDHVGMKYTVSREGEILSSEESKAEWACWKDDVMYIHAEGDRFYLNQEGDTVVNMTGVPYTCSIVSGGKSMFYKNGVYYIWWGAIFHGIGSAGIFSYTEAGDDITKRVTTNKYWVTGMVAIDNMVLCMGFGYPESVDDGCYALYFNDESKIWERKDWDYKLPKIFPGLKRPVGLSLVGETLYVWSNETKTMYTIPKSYFVGAASDFTGVSPAIESDDASSSLYDLQGRPVDGTQRGILIRNGKKMLVK